MKSLFILILLSLVAFGPAQAEDLKQLKKEGLAAIAALGKGLKTELQKAMKEGGPIAALAVCNAQAAPVTLEISKNRGMEIRRTSLKTRNPRNAPDAWERSGLKDFEQRHKKGEDPGRMITTEILSLDGKRVFRMIKAIPLQKACLTCHGSNLQPKVAATLKKLYPKDQATGYRKGQIRGAFSVIKNL